MNNQLTTDNWQLTNSTKDQLRDWDRRHYWHAFTQMAEYEPLIFERAHGCTLIDIDGNEYLDGVSSLWCNIHGHRHPRLDAAIRGQLEKVAHVTSLGASNPTTIELARRLAELAPGDLEHVFFSDDGATAVEVALKIAFQYWRQRPEPRLEKTKYVAFGNAYHGDTLGSVSVGGVERFHATFRPLLFDVLRLPCPDAYRGESGQRSAVSGQQEEADSGQRIADSQNEETSAEGRTGLADRYPLSAIHSPLADRCPLTADRFLIQAEHLLAEHHAEIAAVVIEPLVQGAAGMVMHPPGFLRGLRELTKKYNVLLIADEVAVGMGRTGTMFACEQEGVVPDLLCLAKGLTGGYLPLAATIASGEIFSAFLGRYDELKTFFHGHTYGGNPLGAAVALATLDVFCAERTLENLPPKIAQIGEHLCRIAEHPHVGDARQRGMIAAVELVRDRATKEPFDWRERRGMTVCRHAMSEGVWLRPLGDVIVIMPPLAISLEEIDRIMGAVERGIVAAMENKK